MGSISPQLTEYKKILLPSRNVAIKLPRPCTPEVERVELCLPRVASKSSPQDGIRLLPEDTARARKLDSGPVREFCGMDRPTDSRSRNQLALNLRGIGASLRSRKRCLQCLKDRSSVTASRQRVMLETASIAGGATIAVFLVVIICIAAYIHCKRKQKELRSRYAFVYLYSASVRRLFFLNVWSGQKKKWENEWRTTKDYCSSFTFPLVTIHLSLCYIVQPLILSGR